jgi:hypothetical protein
MATGILGQSSPAATTNTTIYTVPASTTATFNIGICNRGSAEITVRLAIAAAATPVNSEWLEYEAVIPANGVLERTGLVAQAGKLVVAYTSAATASISIFGYEA